MLGLDSPTRRPIATHWSPPLRSADSCAHSRGVPGGSRIRRDVLAVRGERIGAVERRMVHDRIEVALNQRDRVGVLGEAHGDATPGTRTRHRVQRTVRRAVWVGARHDRPTRPVPLLDRQRLNQGWTGVVADREAPCGARATTHPTDLRSTGGRRAGHDRPVRPVPMLHQRDDVSPHTADRPTAKQLVTLGHVTLGKASTSPGLGSA